MLSEENYRDLQERYLRLYSALVYDMLEELGHPHQALDHHIGPLSHHMMVAGPAYPVKGTSKVQRVQRELFMEMLEAMPAGCIAVMDTGHDATVAHWGELVSTSARAQGCQGAVVDGGIRDSRYVLAMDFPVFTRYHTPVEAFGRWGIVDFNTPIYLPGNTVMLVPINPGDYIFGDLDGVLVIPADLTLEVLERAEARMVVETKVRQELTQGDSPLAVYRRYGVF